MRCVLTWELNLDTLHDRFFSPTGIINDFQHPEFKKEIPFLAKGWTETDSRKAPLLSMKQ